MSFKLNRMESPLSNQERLRLNANWDRLEGSYKKVLDDSADAKSTAYKANAKSDNAVKVANRAETVADATQQQLQDIIITSGTSDAEVVAGRTDTETGEVFETIGERMDYQNKKNDINLTSLDERVTTQLAQTTAKIIQLETTKAPITEVQRLELEKAEKTELLSGLNTKRNVSDKIKNTDLDTSADINKIKLVNLSDEVVNAITGNAPAVNTIENGTVTQEKIADGSVSESKLSVQFNYRGILNNTDTLNSVLKAGVYWILPGSQPTGTPAELANKTCILKVSTFNSAYMLQDIYEYANPANSYIRRFYSTASDASAWEPNGKNILSLVPDIITSMLPAPSQFYKGLLNSAHNLNTLNLDSGLYWASDYNSQPINTPASLVGKSYLIEQKQFNDLYAIQVAYEYLNPANSCIRRIYYQNNSMSEWSNQSTLPLQGKKLLTMGDSITYGATSSNNYQDKMAEILGCTIVNDGYSGAKYGLILNHEPWNAHSLYQRSIDIDLTDIDHIFIMFGTNCLTNDVPIGDRSTDEYTSAGALYKALNNLYTRKPTLKIFASTPIFLATENGTDVHDLDTHTNSIGKTIHDYIAAWRKVYQHFGIPYFDAFNESGINLINHTTYLTDKIHPNNAGNELIGTRFANFIKQYV